MCSISSALTTHHSRSAEQQIMKKRLLEKEQGAGRMKTSYGSEPWQVLTLSALRQTWC